MTGTLEVDAACPPLAAYTESRSYPEDGCEQDSVSIFREAAGGTLAGVAAGREGGERGRAVAYCRV